MVAFGLSTNVPSVNACSPNPMMPSNKLNPCDSDGTPKDCLTVATPPRVTSSITKIRERSNPFVQNQVNA